MVQIFAKQSIPLYLTAATSLLLDGAHSFSPSKMHSRTIFTTAPLHVSLSQKYTEENAAYLMDKARECAYSDSCSLEDANLYLKEVVHVQGNCAAGTLNGQQLCEDVVSISEIIVGLRNKVEAASNENLNMARASSEVASVNYPLTPLYVGLAGLCLAVALTTNDPSMATTPFTTQEWWWAARDGYLPDMVHALVRDGGFTILPSDTSMPISSALPFTSQEWWWSVRDGYLGNMVSASITDGGLTSDATADYMPFTAQEWMWSVRDGYVKDMVSHTLRSSLTADATSDYMPFTAQEWMWSVRDGYVKDMVSHTFRS